MDNRRWCQGERDGVIFRLSVEWIVVLYLSCHLHIVRATVRFVEPVDQAGLNGHTEDTLVLHMSPSIGELTRRPRDARNGEWRAEISS